MSTTPFANLLGSAELNLLARAALVLPFVISGVTKIADPAGAFAEARHFGLQPALIVVIVTICVQLGGSALILWGRWAWLGAAALGVFTLAATLIAHDFWNMTEPMARLQNRNIFFEHLAIVGGLILAAMLTQSDTSCPKV